MTLLQADYIFPVTADPIKNGILRVDEQGKILEVIDPALAATAPEAGEVKKYKGFICPGFVNSHCHLELSYLKNKISERTGMTGFITGLLANRGKYPVEEVSEAIAKAEKEMLGNGIIAVGDISNTTDSFQQKSQGNMHYHTFIELLDLGEEKTVEVFVRGEWLQNELNKTKPASHTSSLVPHASYTVSKRLLSLLDNCAYENNSLMTIHNQESEGENELFINKTGPLYDFFTHVGISMDYIERTGVNSLRSTLIHLSNCNKIQLVHNTFSLEEDIQWATHYAKMVYWCFCVNANLFIENRMPDVKNFMPHKTRITLGTDSLASNHSLSILDEMKTVAQYHPWLSFSELLKWATINGAEYFGINKNYGSLEKGKKPGINLLENTDMNSRSINQHTTVKKLF
jgi:cytosine/adenosine deaminase-related metal-dependent hydrolase